MGQLTKEPARHASETRRRRSPGFIIVSCLVVLAVATALFYVVKENWKVPNQVSEEDLPEDPLEAIVMLRTPYMGKHINGSQIAHRLSTPDPKFKQRFIFLQSSSRPYGMTIYFEPDSDEQITLDTLSDHQMIWRTNALIVFAAIENLDEVTFAFRTTPSGNELDDTAYKGRISFDRKLQEQEFGSLYTRSETVEQLEQLILEASR